MYRYAQESNVAYCHVIEVEEDSSAAKRTLCGRRVNGMDVSEKPSEAMCGKCRRKMKKPKG